MERLRFKEFSLVTNGEYLEIEGGTYDGRRLYKKDISSIFLEEKSYTSNTRKGSVGGSVRIAKGVYLSTSTPYYDKKTISAYTPKIVLKDLEVLSFSRISDSSLSYASYKQNIEKVKSWLSSNDLFEYKVIQHNKEIRHKKESREGATIVIAIWVWLIAIVVSLFSGAVNFLIFLFIFPLILAVISMIGYKRK